MDRVICDRCNNYEIHPSGVSEQCHEMRENSNVILNHIDPCYIKLRLNGSKNFCKRFKPLPKVKKSIKNTILKK
jgi:hypothetical protein